MNTIDRKQNDRPRKLMPHQADFVDTVLNPASKHIISLRGDVGLGKTTALVALASRLLETQPAARILLLCPATLRDYFVEKLCDEGSPAILFDRYKFREFLDAASSKDIWPSGAVVVMSYNFAKKPDIRDCLMSSNWDLLIIDEAHHLLGPSVDFFLCINSVAAQVVLASATTMMPVTTSKMILDETTPVSTARMNDTTIIEWNRDSLFDFNGKQISTVPPPLINKVYFALSVAEEKIEKDVVEICRTVAACSSQQNFIIQTLLRSFHSSPTAFEGVLRNAMEIESIRDDFNAFEDDIDSIDAEKISSRHNSPFTDDKVRIMGGRILEELETLQVDSKLERFDKLLSQLTHSESPDKRICVITGYKGTLYSLVADIEDRNLACLKLHGGMSHGARCKTLADFNDRGGILVATMAVLSEGVDLPDVRDIVFYDLPVNEFQLQQMMGRFDRFGRTKQLHVHLLVGPTTDKIVNFL